MQSKRERNAHGEIPGRRGRARLPEPILNDVHARLNASRPALYRRPNSIEEVAAALLQARRRGLDVAVAGGRHAMGGQQFRDGGCVLDLRSLDRILAFDPERGLITVEAGATWPQLMRGYLSLQAGRSVQWGIRQKQTGADNLTLGGALAANIHGRGLTCPPFSADVVSFDIVMASGERLFCSREREPELFSLVVGGYGLFGVVVAVTLTLTPRQKVERGSGFCRCRNFRAPLTQGSQRVTRSATFSLRRIRSWPVSCATASSPATDRWTTPL
jgi:FAD/FMN-containing dehydrogenase